jgi:thioredoxin reductase (NADPH)
MFFSLVATKHSGGDAAMEDALVLARTSRKVTVVHRRDAFRASKVLADRVLQHPGITVVWNTRPQEILGKELPRDEETEDLDAPAQKVVTGAVLEDVRTGETTRVDCHAVFVAIGHTPTTSFLKGVVDFDPNHPGYLWTNRHGKHFQTQTSVRGIFAAGDVADAVYRQAVTSAGSGAAAALDAERYLSEEGLGNEEAELEAELLAELMADSAARAASAGADSGAYNVYAEAGGRIHGVKESIAAEL